jgi:thiosulfate dehydrogenase
MKRAPIFILIAILVILVAKGIIFFTHHHEKNTNFPAGSPLSASSIKHEWVAPDTSLIPHTAEGDLIRFGRKLIANTSFYFGPRGTINHQANGMNCQNCHLDAGTRIFSNSFAGVASQYPQFRPRSGRIESVEFKINECLERSLNGTKIDSAGLAMKSMAAYVKWVGKAIPKGTKPRGAGTEELSLMSRPADTLKGSFVYQIKCQSCHGVNGQGLLSPDKKAFTYPPLWGEHSYNISAGIFRITKLAGYIKYAMPLGTKYPVSQLTDEQIWDVAAFINSRPHPVKFFKYDWPILESKPVDYPFGPYTDSFSEQQHKYGPFISIKEAKDALAK